MRGESPKPVNRTGDKKMSKIKMGVSTPAELEAAITPEIVDAAAELIAAKAVVETVKPIVRGYQTAILEAHQWRIARKWVEQGCEDTVILDPDLAFELEDEDFQVYLAEINEARKQAGLHVESEDHCPLLVAEHNESKAKWKLAELMRPIVGFGLDDVLCKQDGLERSKEYIDILLGLLMPYVTGEQKLKRS